MNVGKHTVKWSYVEDFIPQHSKGKVVERKRDITICQILVTETSEVVAEESIARLWKEANCRDKARKYSLEKVLAFSSFTKKERGEFWEEFRTQTKTPKWSKPGL